MLAFALTLLLVEAVAVAAGFVVASVTTAVAPTSIVLVSLGYLPSVTTAAFAAIGRIPPQRSCGLMMFQCWRDRS